MQMLQRFVSNVLRVVSISIELLFPRRLMRIVVASAVPAAVLSFSLVACMKAQTPTKRARIIGVEPIPSVMSIRSHASAVSEWMQGGYENMTVVHAEPRDGLAFIPAERMKEIENLIKQRSSAIYNGNMISSDNYLFAAARLGLVRRIFWIIPYRYLNYINAEERIRLFLRSETSHFRHKDIDSMRFRNGCVSGNLAGIEMNICSPLTMPSLQEPVLMTIDAGFFSAFAVQKEVSKLTAMKDFFDLIALRKIKAQSVIVVSSPELKATEGYLSEQTAAILKDPSLLRRDAPPGLWTVRDRADNMLTGGGFREAAEYLDKNIGAYPNDPYLFLMRQTAHALISGGRSALEDMVRLCTKKPDFCHAIVDTGILLRDNGNLQGAEEFLRKAQSLQPVLYDARIEYALTLYKSRKYAEARAALLPLSDSKLSVKAGLLLGDCAYALNHDSEALDWYEKALKSYREWGLYRLNGWEKESVNRLKSLYEKRNDRQGLLVLEKTLSVE